MAWEFVKVGQGMNLRINTSGGIHTLMNLDCNLKPRFKTSFMYSIRHDNEAFKDMRTI
jgi:hypothetical protein